MKASTALLLALTLPFGGPLMAQGGHQGHHLDGNLILPHFALGDGFTTEVVLFVAQDSTPVSGTLYFYGQDGSPLSVVADEETVTEVDVTIPGEGVRFVAVGPVSEALEVGWALFEVSEEDGDRRGNVHGSVIFTRLDGEATETKVGVIPGRYESGHHGAVVLPVTAGVTSNTGVAWVNSGPGSMDVIFLLRDADGTVVAEDATIDPPVSPIDAGNKQALFLTELFPDVDFTDFQGTLTLLTDEEGLVATGLLADGDILTAIPVAHTARDSGPGPGPDPETHTVVNEGFTFSPDTLTITQGDTVQWNLDQIHTVVEVSEASWNANDTTSNGGFQLPFGGGSFTFDEVGTFYYVCGPHGNTGMKGRIIVEAAE